MPLVSMTVTKMSEKRRFLLVFTSCFNFLRSKVNPVVVPTNLGSRLFFFGVTLLGGAGVGTVPHFSFSCLAVLLAFFIIAYFLIVGVFHIAVVVFLRESHTEYLSA